MVKFEFKSIKIKAVCTALPLSDSKHSVNEQTTSDLGYEAAIKIIEEKHIELNEIGIILFISKTADYRGPATALVLHQRLQLPIDCLAFDTPIGSCGFETALNIGAALLTTNNTKMALCIFGDTTSKQLSAEDFLQNEIIDAATAIVLEKTDLEETVKIENLTLSNYWQQYVIPSGGFRTNKLFDHLTSKRENQSSENLHIDFSAIDTAFTPKITEILSNKLQNATQKPIVLINSWSKNLALGIKELCTINNIECYYINTNQYAFAASVPLLLEQLKTQEKQEIYNILSISFGEGLAMVTSEFSIQSTAVLSTIKTDVFFDNGFVTHEM